MNSGTTAAKEAANMVDLDSDPTKILEVVEIGKQLLITRGSLTTFSIANDIAKYFAIIPAMFMAAIPQLGVLNIMHLSTQNSAILSALIFNAIIIPCLIPLAMKGVKYRPMSSGKMLARNMMIYGLGGVVTPFVRHQNHRHSDCPDSGRTAYLRRLLTMDEVTYKNTFFHSLRQSLVMALILLLLCGFVFPVLLSGISAVLFPSQANGSLVYSYGQAVGSAHVGQEFTKPYFMKGRPSAYHYNTYYQDEQGQPVLQ